MNKPKVYVVSKCFDYQGCELVAVCATKELAEQLLEYNDHRYQRGNEIEQVEILETVEQVRAVK